MSTVTINRVFGGDPLPLSCITFPAGEPHVVADIDGCEYVWVDARIASSHDWMNLMMTLDAIRGQHPKRLGLFIPYFPGSRQDRREHGGSLSVKVYADMLEPFKLDCVLTVDPHSDVLRACIDVDVIEAAEVLGWQHLPLKDTYDAVIAPDAGAVKRASKVAAELGVDTVMLARKHRDPRTGKLYGFSCDSAEEGGTYLVADDICDGGGTFNGLAQAILGHTGHVTLDLFVSHGIFSKGVDALPQFRQIITTDSFPHPAGHDLVILPLHDIAQHHIARRISQ